LKKRGSVTVFIALIFVCIAALICALLESARTSSARLYLQTAGDSAIDSLFSRYHRAMWDNYRIFAFESENDENIGDLMCEYMKPYVRNCGMYRIQNPVVSLNKKISLNDKGGMYLEQEIIDYMKLGTFESVFDGSPDKLWKDIEDAKSMEKITSDYGLSSREAIDVEKALKRLSENIEAQEKIKLKMKESLDNNNLGELKKLSDNLKAKLKKVPELVKKYEKKADKMSAKLREIEAKNSSNLDKLSESNRAYIEGEIEKFKDYVDKDSERRLEVTALSSQSESIITELDNLESDIESLQSILDEASEDDEGDYSSEISDGWSRVSDDVYSLGEMKLSCKHGIADEDKEDKLKQLKDMISNGVFSLVIPSNRTVSNKSINTLSLPSNATTGGYTGRNLAERLLIDEYMGKYFADFTDDINTPLSYELEYILNGASSDRANLESAVQLAAAISGALCLPQITFIVKFLIIAVWALVESAIDIKGLLSGGKVPIIKSGEDWHTDLDSIFDVLSSKDLGNSDEFKRGISYEGYLKMLLYIEDPVKRNFRMMDIMQLDIGVNQKDFLIKDMVYGVDANISCGAKRLFSEISLFSKEFSGLSSGYSMEVRVEKIY